jgi:hypothetical protein
VISVKNLLISASSVSLVWEPYFGQD